MDYGYPKYAAALTPEVLAGCRDVAQRLLDEVGLEVAHDKFRAALEGREGVRIVGKRVHLARALTDRLFEAYITAQRKKLEAAAAAPTDPTWSISNDGFSIMVIDNETDHVREATRQDLRDSIRLVRSFGMGGSYPCTPQDVPPMMRALSCFKICWEEADNIRPFDYLDIRQTPFLYEMHEVMGKSMTIVVNIVDPMAVSPHDLEIFMRFYPLWKRQPSRVNFYSVCDYPMLGVTKPVTSTGALACYLSQSFGTSFLFSLFDPELSVLPRLSAGLPVDLRSMCWAWGSPRFHLYQFLNEQALPALCGLRPGRYAPVSAMMSTSSCAVDLRSGMEKMATALMGAMQGARHFSGAGNLAVDDLFSGIQLVADVEIFEYVKEVVESFSPHSDLLATEGLDEVLREVGLRTDEFYSHPDTAAKARHLLPVSVRRPSEKLRTWMTHSKNLKDRLRAECLERIRKQPPFTLAEDKRRALDQIYARAEKELSL